MKEKVTEKEIERKIENNFEDCCKKGHKNHHHCHGGGDGVYCLGVIGAAIFFIGQAPTFWLGALGLLKAFIWPVFFVYESLKFLIG